MERQEWIKNRSQAENKLIRRESFNENSNQERRIFHQLDPLTIDEYGKHLQELETSLLQRMKDIEVQYDWFQKKLLELRKEFMDKEIRKIEKEVKSKKLKKASKDLKHLEKADKKRDKFVDAGKKALKNK